MKKILFLTAVVFLGLVFSSNRFQAQAAGCEEGFEPLGGAGQVCIPMGTGLSDAPVKDILVAVLEWLLGIFGALGVLTFIISGVFYLTAAGDAELEKKAKNAMTMGIMGVIVGLAGFVVIQAIDMALNAMRGF